MSVCEEYDHEEGDKHSNILLENSGFWQITTTTTFYYFFTVWFAIVSAFAAARTRDSDSDENQLSVNTAKIKVSLEDKSMESPASLPAEEAVNQIKYYSLSTIECEQSTGDLSHFPFLTSVD